MLGRKRGEIKVREEMGKRTRGRRKDEVVEREEDEE